MKSFRYCVRISTDIPIAADQRRRRLQLCEIELPKKDCLACGAAFLVATVGPLNRIRRSGNPPILLFPTRNSRFDAR